jgi:inner membrane transporter RhtA
MYSLAVDVLCSVVRYSAGVKALRQVPTQFLGVLMSLNSSWAAVVGLVLLGQVLAVHAWVGIHLVVLANVLALVAAGRKSRDREHRAVETRISLTDVKPSTSRHPR